jgi:hypothetical protein
METRASETFEQAISVINEERNRADQAEIQKSKMENLLKDKQLDIEELLNKITKSQQESRNRQEDMNAKMIALENETCLLRDFELKSRKLEGNNLELLARIDALQDELSKKGIELGQRGQRIEGLEKEKLSMIESQETTHRTLREKEIILQEFDLKLEELLKGINEKTQALKENEAMMEVLKGNFTQLELKLEQKTSLVEELKKMHLDEIKTILNRVNAMEVELGQKQLTVTEYSQKNTLLAQELSGCKDKISAIEQVNKELETKNFTIEQEFRKALVNKDGMERENATFAKQLDELNLSVEVLKSSLKSRQVSHEQTIEELSKVRNHLNRTLTENSSSISLEEAESMRAGFEKQIVRLRVELEKSKEQFSREKKLLLLRIEELEEQQQAKENQTPTNTKTSNHLNTTPTLNVKTPPSQQPAAAAIQKVKTPKQQFKYKSFLSPTETKEVKEKEEKKPAKAAPSAKVKEPAPECSQQ